MTTRSTAINEVFGVLLATFPAEPTDQAVNDLQEALLREVEAVQPEGIVIDISRVTTLDSFFARVISDTADMVSLMGGEVVIVGMRPSVAITAAELGYGFEDIETARDTDHALSLLGVEGQSASNGEQSAAHATDAAPGRRSSQQPNPEQERPTMGHEGQNRHE